MLVKDIMSKKVLSLKPGDNVSRFISLIEKNRIHQVVLLDDKNTLKGIVDYKTLLTKNILDPTATKLSKISHKSPTIDPENDIETAADLIFKTGTRALPVVKNKKVIGIISVYDIIENAAKSKEFRQTRIEKIMPEVQVVTELDDIGKTRVIMREKGISRLPVINKEGKLSGVVTVFDLIKSIKPRQRVGWYSMAGKIDRLMASPVTTIMDQKPITARKGNSLNEVANLMARKRVSGVFITDDSNKPVGVITTKDLLEVFVGGTQQEGVYYQIIGLTDEDDFIVDAVDKMVNNTVSKLSNMFEPEFLFVHIKRYDSEGFRFRYTIKTRFKVKNRLFFTQASAWDLREAIGDALSKLEKVAIKDKNILRQNQKEKAKRNKDLRRGGR